MKNLIIILLSILFINKIVLAQENFKYISPKDGSKLVSLNTSLIFNANHEINLSNINGQLIEIIGTKSGIHKVKFKLSADKKTLILLPLKKFLPDENVTVNINQKIKTVNGEEITAKSFSFKTTPLKQPIKLSPFSTVADGFNLKENLNISSHSTLMKSSSSKIDTLPSDFPKITIDLLNNPADGKVFLANFPFGVNDSIGHFLIIENNDGMPDTYKRIDNPGFDFKVQPNGDLSYAEVIQQVGGYANVRWIVLDTTLTPIDTFQCGNGYTADLHEFKLLPNGHALLMAYDPEPVDMSLEVDGGDPNATVLGCIVQELDESKNVIFQWRSWDYIPFTDSYENLTTKTVDYMHMNAVAVDQDGNYLISGRHLSQILKVDRNTGDIIWRLGGKQNEFTFANENEVNSPNYFSYQHDISVLSNGNITLFDNGNQHSPQYSRAVEYKLDETNKTANMVWEYRHTPDIYTLAMGSVQRLSNGNTFIGWGSAGMNGNPSATEVHPDNSIAFELTLPKGETSYRAFRFPWKSKLPSVTVTAYEIYQGNTYKFDESNDTTGISVKINQIDGLAYTSLTVTTYNYSPAYLQFNGDAPIVKKEYFNLNGSSINSFEGEMHVNLKYHPKITDPQNTIVYLKTLNGSTFEPLATSYSSTQNELIFTTSQFGDYIFGVPVNVDSTYSPVTISPVNEEIVNEESPVELMWGTRGIVSNYQFQISTDSLFSNIIIDDTALVTSKRIGGFDNDTKYYWRVRANNSSGESEWSDTSSFVTAAPFISVLYPNGSEEFDGDSTYIIRWQDNLSSLVNISLYKNDTLSIVIADSLESETNAYSWQVPSTLVKDSHYKIKITSINDNSLFDLSDNDFFINTGITGINEVSNTLKTYKLFQNYPNPFNPSTKIQYVLPKASNVTISVFNVVGQKVAVLVKKVQQAGEHEVVWNANNLASGVYFLKIKAVGLNGKSNFSAYKKAVLLK